MELSEVTRENIEKELSELESQYGMPTSRLVWAFKNGKLRETPDFRRWVHLDATLTLFDRQTVRV